MKESELLKRIQLAATKLGYRLFRNQVGAGYIGKVDHISHTQQVTVYPGDKIIRQGRRFTAGLCKGSADLIGWKSVIITEDMVGSKIAQFTGFEAKTKNLKPSIEQTRFIDAVNAQGGFAQVIRESDDLEAVL